VCADFRNPEEELKNALATSRSKVRDLESKVREIEDGGFELKQAMKEATESEYAISQKLAYETAARRSLFRRKGISNGPLSIVLSILLTGSCFC
jgi:Skp family chaperone for outer membrane proteins